MDATTDAGGAKPGGNAEAKPGGNAEAKPGGNAEAKPGGEAGAEPKPKTSHKAFFWAVILVGVLLYVVAIFNTINAVRKIHASYIRGFYFQKECKDEYTEYESLRRHTYEAIKSIRVDLDASAYANLLLIFWIPVSVLLLLTGHMIGISTAWAGALGVLMVYVAYFMSNRFLDPTAEGKLYPLFEGSYCDTAHTTNLPTMRRFQVLVAVFVGAIVYGYYTVHSTYDNGTKPVFINKFPSILQSKAMEAIRSKDETKYPFGYRLYQYAHKRNYAFYTLLILWAFAFVWIYRTAKSHQQLRDRVLCHYETLMGEYTFVLENYIYPDPKNYASQEAYDRETEKRFNWVKDHMERNYFRIHQTMPVPNITEDTIGDYTIYLMNWRGREFETLPESPELNQLRDFMYRLRNDKVYTRAVEDYLRFSKRYLLFHFIVLMYIVFHVLYKRFRLQNVMKWMIGVGIITGLFMLSWYAWFDVALRV